jgi:Uma2 family endonuclease
MSVAATSFVTAEELFDMGDIGRCELVNGEIIHMAPPGFEHGDVSVEIAYQIKAFLRGKRLGKVVGEVGFILTRNPDTVRAPDVAFVRQDRVPTTRAGRFFDGAPDLAIEVISPSDRRSEVSAKVDQWLRAGALSVWVVDPPNRSIEVYRPANQVIRYRAGDELHDEPTLPGFTLKLADLFAGD